MTEQSCPYRSKRTTKAYRTDYGIGVNEYTCGQDGWICDMCKEDRADAVRRLSERIEAVEKAIQDTRVDQGEMGLVNEQDMGDLRGRVERLFNRVAALEAREAEK